MQHHRFRSFQRALWCAWFAFVSTSPGADRPLAAGATALSKNLTKGCIVTAEQIGGEVSTASAGTLEPGGVPPEKVLFEIGSISKVFTGLLFAQAIIEGKARLDMPLSEALEGSIAMTDPKVAGITLEQLATHTSGLPRLPPNIGPNPDGTPDPYAGYDRARLDAYLKTATLKDPAPQPAAYSNLGMALLGDILSRRYHKRWEDLVKEKITGPLGMTDTVLTLSPEQQQRLAPPYKGGGNGVSWTFQAFAGAGGLRSTASDMIRFGNAFISPEKTPLKDAIALVTQPHAQFGDMGAQIGLALFLSKVDGHRVFDHAGATGSYHSMLQVQPERGIVRVVLANNSEAKVEAVIAATREAPKAADRPIVQLPGAQLKLYEGVYELGAQARFTVIAKEPHLWIRLTGQPFAPVQAVGGDRFINKAVAAEFQFSRADGAAGSFDTLTLFQHGREMPSTRSAKAMPTIQLRTAKELQPYAGIYDLAPGAAFTLTVRASTLFAELTGQQALPVFETRQDYFEYDVVEAALEFQRNKEGEITGLILHQNGDHPAPKRTTP